MIGFRLPYCIALPIGHSDLKTRLKQSNAGLRFAKHREIRCHAALRLCCHRVGARRDSPSARHVGANQSESSGSVHKLARVPIGFGGERGVAVRSLRLRCAPAKLPPLAGSSRRSVGERQRWGLSRLTAHSHFLQAPQKQLRAACCHAARYPFRSSEQFYFAVWTIAGGFHVPSSAACCGR